MIHSKLRTLGEINRVGGLLSASVVESSGDPVFDAAALATLKRSDPMPRPREGAVHSVPLFGTVVRPYDAPENPFAPGHRGVDVGAPTGIRPGPPTDRGPGAPQDRRTRNNHVYHTHRVPVLR